ncbi:aldo/keto reductase [Pasteurella testudinis]|uniref:aldo/keto reductase n=1 Tax=Pasteurella testudinis TaxID=761 RepID=UPI004059E3BE
MNPSRRDLLKHSGLTALAMGVSALAPGFAAAQAQPAQQAKPSRYGLPDNRRLGSLRVSAIGLGCQEFGQNMYGVPMPSRAHSVAVIRQAFEHGITFFDTAEAYGPFESERVVGEALKPFRDDVVIASKFGWDIDQTSGQRTGKLNSRPEHIKRVVDAMLQRLQTDRIDLLYQHRVDPEVPIAEVAGAVQDLMKQGKVLHWGLSEAGTATIEKAHQVQALTAVQSEYSLFWRGREQDVIPLCEKLGIGFVPWSPLAMGMLGGYVDEQTEFAADPNLDLRGIIPRFEKQAMAHNMGLVRLVQKWAKRKLCTPAQLSLAWLLAQKDFIVPIPGTTKSYHLLENIGSTALAFSPDELQAFTRELDAFQVQGLRLPAAILQFSDK